LGAIPSSDMPGHASLHEKVVVALNRCQETQAVDFKESAAWEDLKWRVIKSLMGMGNLRDGGIIVIGASERNSTWELTGIAAAHLATYDVDIIIAQANAYASLHLDIDVVTVKHENGQTFLAMQSREFTDTPIVCKKNAEVKSQGQTRLVLEEGAVYIRPPGMARTTKVTDAQQMHDLLELAAEKRARRILETAARIGLYPPTVADPSAAERFDQELGDL
jgi:hypothetical protein